jgi:hypothetical protein
MCNLYSISRDPESVRRLFRISHTRAVVFDPVQAIFPNYNVPI